MAYICRADHTILPARARLGSRDWLNYCIHAKKLILIIWYPFIYYFVRIFLNFIKSIRTYVTCLCLLPQHIVFHKRKEITNIYFHMLQLPTIYSLPSWTKKIAGYHFLFLFCIQLKFSSVKSTNIFKSVIPRHNGWWFPFKLYCHILKSPWGNC